MCKIKYYLLLRKNYPQFFSGITMISTVFWIILRTNLMNLNETKKDVNPEIRKELEKSKLKVLTNENDFLVKNLKKAGWFIRAKKFFKQQNFLNNKIFKNSFLERNNDFLNDYPKNLNLSNIKFLLNIQINAPNTKHIK